MQNNSESIRVFDISKLSGVFNAYMDINIK